jgi:hypothetical protein
METIDVEPSNSSNSSDYLRQPISNTWWLLLEAVDISTTVLMSEVACETCQCKPTAEVDAGICLRSIIKLRMEQ